MLRTNVSIIDQRSDFKQSIRKQKICKTSQESLLNKKEKVSSINQFIDEVNSKCLVDAHSCPVDPDSLILSATDPNVVAEIIVGQSTTNEKRKAFFILKNAIKEYTLTQSDQPHQFSFNSEKILRALVYTLSNPADQLPDLMLECLNILLFLSKHGKADLYHILDQIPELISNLAKLNVNFQFIDISLISCELTSTIINSFESEDQDKPSSYSIYSCRHLCQDNRYLEGILKKLAVEARDIGELILLQHLNIIIESVNVINYITQFYDLLPKFSFILSKNQFDSQLEKTNYSLTAQLLYKLIVSAFNQEENSELSAEYNQLDEIEKQEYLEHSQLYQGLTYAGYSFICILFCGDFISKAVDCLQGNVLDRLRDKIQFIGSFKKICLFNPFQIFIKKCFNFINNYIKEIVNKPAILEEDIDHREYLKICLSFVNEAYLSKSNISDNFEYISKKTMILKNLGFLFSTSIDIEIQEDILILFESILYNESKAYLHICTKSFHLKLLAVFDSMDLYFKSNSGISIVANSVLILESFLAFWNEIGPRNYLLDEVVKFTGVHILENLKLKFEEINFPTIIPSIIKLIEYWNSYMNK